MGKKKHQKNHLFEDECVVDFSPQKSLQDIKNLLESIDPFIASHLAALFEVFTSRLMRRHPSLRRKAIDYKRGKVDGFSFFQWIHETYEEELRISLEKMVDSIKDHLSRKPDGFTTIDLRDIQSAIIKFVDFYERFPIEEWLRAASEWAEVPWSAVQRPYYPTKDGKGRIIPFNIDQLRNSAIQELYSQMIALAQNRDPKEPHIEFDKGFTIIKLVQHGKKDLWFRVGPKQGKIFEALHNANQTENEWVYRDKLLGAAKYSEGSSIGKKFPKGQKEAYNALIEPQQRGKWFGHYRLKYPSKAR